MTIQLDDRRKAAANSTYKKLAVQWLNEALSFVSSFVVADSLVLPCLLEAVRQGNRQLLVAAKRWLQWGGSVDRDALNY